MAVSQSSSSSYDFSSYSSSSSFDEDHPSDSYDDELEDEQLVAPDSQESPTLVGSDTEYRCESEPDSEADSAKKNKTKSKTKTNTNVEAKSKNKSNEKRPREKPEEKGGDASNKKRKKAENETNLQTGGDNAKDKDKEMMKKKKNKSRSSSSAAANARVWSERDELVMVKGIISFLKKFTTFDGKKFYNWINKYIEADVSTGQIADKVCRLKKKYRNNEANRGPNGEDPVFSKPHEQKLFELSKQAWGSIRSTTNNNNNTKADINDGIVEEGADAQKKATDVVDDDNLQEKEVLFDDNLVMEAFDKYLTSRGLDLRWFSQDKLGSLENKWRKIRVAESTFRLLQAKFDAKLHQIALHACNFFDY